MESEFLPLEHSLVFRDEVRGYIELQAPLQYECEKQPRGTVRSHGRGDDDMGVEDDLHRAIRPF